MSDANRKGREIKSCARRALAGQLAQPIKEHGEYHAQTLF